MTVPVPGDLAFVGPAHLKELSDFQYVELIAVENGIATVKVVGPDEDDDEKQLSLPVDNFTHRAEASSERDRWPGSYIAHPVAFAWTSADGVDEWTYGVVSGYTLSELMTTLHVVCQDRSIRLPLTSTTSVITVDVLNYALQTGVRGNTAAVSPPELLEQQNKVITLCQRRRAGIPKAVKTMMSVPFAGDDIVPLIRPSNLQLVRVRRQHAVDYETAARTKRPSDLYADPGAESGALATQATHNEGLRRRLTNRSGRGRPLTSDSESDNNLSDQDIVMPPDSLESEDEDIREVQHMHRPLTKRRRVERTDTVSHSDSSSSDEDLSTHNGSRNRGVVFHPSPTDRRVHNAVVRHRHAGKEPQMLLQSAQQSQHLDFIGTPPVLCGAYYFGFGVGLSIMHFRRAVIKDEVATTESGVNMWDFSSKNSLPTPPRASSLSDLIGALSSFHKFAKYFYNKYTKRFIGAARDFVIAYADSATPDPVMARLLTHWINCKLGKFRNRLITEGLRAALLVQKEFSRTDEQLIALKESYPSWQKPTASVNHQRGGAADSIVRSNRQQESRQSTKLRIPANVISSLPKGEDGRRLCMRYVSIVGCNTSDCARAHFRPDSLTEEAKAVITERWKGLSAECKDL